jgi:hypothetical protein
VKLSKRGILVGDAGTPADFRLDTLPQLTVCHLSDAALQISGVAKLFK